MDWYLLLKMTHILSATIVFGTGMGIAFFMFRSHFTGNITEKLYAAKSTVLADMVFTLPAVIVQPITGFLLIWNGGYDWQEKWLIITYIIYIMAGICWVPVVWIQIELKKMLIAADQNNGLLPSRYNKLFRIWFILGWPAFIGLVIVFGLMVAKPSW